MNGPDLLVRPARTEDLKALAALLTRLHDKPPWGIGQDGEALATLGAIVSDPMRRLLIGFVDDTPAGTLDVLIARNLTRGLRPFAVIENLIVDPDHREVGLGTKLMEDALNFACGLDCYKVQLVSANRRDSAHRLYLSLGFHADVSGFRRYLLDVD